MRPFLLLPLFALGCSTPNFIANKTIDMTLPAASLRQLRCDSHNGSITVTGEAGRTDIGVHAELSVRGYTQEEADSNLTLLELGRDETGDTLHLYGRHPEGTLDNRSPWYKFTLVVPDRLAVMLGSHNGNLSIAGTEGNAKLETHNGDIKGTVTGDRLDATTHNGDVRLRIAGGTALDGNVTTHNGNVDLDLDENVNAMLDVSTHNGSVQGPSSVSNARVSRHGLRGQLGDGTGRLTVESHNGNIVLR